MRLWLRDGEGILTLVKVAAAFMADELATADLEEELASDDLLLGCDDLLLGSDDAATDELVGKPGSGLTGGCLESPPQPLIIAERKTVAKAETLK